MNKPNLITKLRGKKCQINLLSIENVAADHEKEMTRLNFHGSSRQESPPIGGNTFSVTRKRKLPKT